MVEQEAKVAVLWVLVGLVLIVVIGPLLCFLGLVWWEDRKYWRQGAGHKAGDQVGDKIGDQAAEAEHERWKGS